MRSHTGGAGGSPAMGMRNVRMATEICVSMVFRPGPRAGRPRPQLGREFGSEMSGGRRGPKTPSKPKPGAIFKICCKMKIAFPLFSFRSCMARVFPHAGRVRRLRPPRANKERVEPCSGRARLRPGRRSKGVPGTPRSRGRDEARPSQFPIPFWERKTRPRRGEAERNGGACRSWLRKRGRGGAYSLKAERMRLVAPSGFFSAPVAASSAEPPCIVVPGMVGAMRMRPVPR